MAYNVQVKKNLALPRAKVFAALTDFVLAGGTLAWMIDWRVGVCAWGIFLILVVFTQYVSLGSLAAAAMLAAATCIFVPAPAAKILALLSAAIIIFAHRENIKRLKNGTESKLSFGGKSKTDL